MTVLALDQVLLDALERVRSVGVITGAGISAESGVPTYRGKGGIYDDPEEGDRTIEALSGDTLERDPDRTWRTIADLARRSHAAHPNAAHRALVDIERKAARFVLLTQNVDNLHQRAGSRNVIDIHGDVFGTVCMGCDARGRLTPAMLEDLSASPRCGGSLARGVPGPSCGAILRPDVVLFGEMLPLEKFQRIRSELLTEVPDLILVAGTSALFPYIMEPVILARRLGRLTLEVNPEETVLTDIVKHSIRARAGDVLPLVAAHLGASAPP